MDELLKDLQRSLHLEYEVQIELRGELTRKVQVLMSQSADGLEEILENLDRLVFKSRNLELKRRDVAGRLASAVGYDQQPLVLDELLSKAGERGLEAARTREKLVVLRDEVRALNRRCQTLLEDSVSMIDEILRVVDGHRSTSVATYDAEGRVAPNKSSVYDREA